VIHSTLGRLVSKRMSIVGLLAALAVMAVASPAMAAKEFSVFAQCPTANPEAFDCIHSLTTSGEVKVGNTAVPIVNAITLQGAIPNPFSGKAELIAAKNGETLSKTGQPVPGGLLGIVAPTGWPKILQDIFNAFINEGATGVKAVTELVGKGQVALFNFIGGNETAVFLPVRVKLENPFLGGACYIGSSKSPLALNLTTGTTSPPGPNTPIKGAVGTLSENAEETILFDKGFSLVDNAFAAGGAEGCGGIFSLLVDAAADLKLGLPSAAGKNTAILKGEQQIATTEAVIAHP